MQQFDVYYYLLSQHVSGIIMPIFKRSKTVLTAFGVLLLLCWMWLVAVVGRYQPHLLSQHVSGIIMPIFRRTEALLLHLVCCSGSVGCGW